MSFSVSSLSPSLFSLRIPFSPQPLPPLIVLYSPLCCHQAPFNGSSRFFSLSLLLQIVKLTLSSITKEIKGHSPASTNRKSNNKMIASSAVASEPTAKSSEVSSSPAKPHGKGVDSSVVAKKRSRYSTATSPISSKSSGKAIVSSANGGEVMFFKDVSVGPHQEELRFRLVYFWEARNPISKLEMLLIGAPY